MLKGILAISGQRGLFKVVSQAKNSIIVESLIDGKRMPAYATSRISALEDISIYTEDEDVKLFDVFKAIYEKENGGASIAPKSSGKELKAYFEDILPLYDKDRVYVSDIKKVLTWYNLLIENELFDPNATEEEEEESTED
ncbi:DUF5606 domain-containing protein [Carboxylicivirga sp. M1479]|uniref:DUF5606 family protein n=1 Tax=Carboxylicivirga sp. M1479 TaxID=2594476 RepID=UPI0011784253|nr:DUF5606 domain-containing protein [Carboxylicivirga sp. M1479]TRX70737.1 hypothetical protein FNN09_09595 [Carboxylicivirga sp. M1479]